MTVKKLWAAEPFAAEHAKGRRRSGALSMLPVADKPMILEDQVIYITDVGRLYSHRGILLCIRGFTQYMRAHGKNCTQFGNRRKMS